VLLGEASHGTHEFYRERAEISKRLITEQGFTAVAVEGDFPDAYRVNRFVRGESDDADAEEALSDFRSSTPIRSASAARSGVKTTRSPSSLSSRRSPRKPRTAWTTTSTPS
jgi:hypothetical protein